LPAVFLTPERAGNNIQEAKMLVNAYVEHKADGWYVVEEYGWDFPDRTGPYQWRWWARLLAWLADDTH
jgi:hypothetical protein